jgi:hypothetical protein
LTHFQLILLTEIVSTEIVPTDNYSFYSALRMTMRKYCKQWINDWCEENGWTDLFMVQRDYWAFPPQAVMPMPIPSQVLRSIKSQRGMTLEEKLWYGAAWVASGSAIACTYTLQCPLPLVAAFALCAIIFARTDDE